MASFTSLQAAFGQPEDITEPEPIETVQRPPVDDDLLQRLEQTRAAQQDSLAQHEQHAAGLQRAQSAVQERQADLQLISEFSRITDAQYPKPARDYMWRQFVRSRLGLDPNSPATKEVGKLIGQLDSESLQALRGSLIQASANAQPGQMRQLLTAAARGDLPPDALLQQVAGYRQQQAAETAGGLVHLASDTTRVPAPSQTERPAVLQEAPSELNALLPGLEPGQRYRVQDVQELYPAVPSDQVGLRKLADTLKQENATMRTLLDQATDLQRLIQGNPSALGPVGTGAQYWESFRAQMSAMIGIARENLPDPESSAIRRTADWLSNRVLQMHGLERSAENRARINALVTRMAYAMLRQDEPGGRYTEQDIIRAMQQIGQSADPKQFQASLQTTIGNQYRAYQQRMSEALGAEYHLPIDKLPSTRIAEIGQNPMMPLELRKQAAVIWKQRGMDRPTEMREAVGKPGAAAADDISNEPRQRQGRTPSIEQEEMTLRQRQAELERLTREATRLQMQLAIRRDERGERSEARADRIERRQEQWRAEDKAEREQERLRALFERIGRLVASGAARGGGSRGGSGGADQSPNAFVIPQRGSRRAPSVPSIPSRGFEGFNPAVRGQQAPRSPLADRRR
jgi:hypothetical protein